MNVLLLIVIAVFLWFDHYIMKRDKYIFIMCILIAIILNVKRNFDVLSIWPDSKYQLVLIKFQSFIGYVTRPLLLWGLWEILRGEKKQWIRRFFFGLALGNVLVFSTCFFSDLTFRIDPITYKWSRGPLGLTAHYVMVLMMILFIPTLINLYLSKRKNDFLTGIFSLLVILISVYLDTYHNMNTLPDIITIECIIYFLFLHIELEKEYTKALMVAQKAEMMMMQIKPHFINNTLSTIQALCEIDPVQAARTTGNFARYLRMNLTSMDKPLPIPIKEELEHTKTYLEIEMLRFPWIEVEYDIQDTEFCVPPLSIQPLVENAIQHGLRKQKHGKVWISTKETEKGHMVIVTDNGSGFDEKNPVTKEGHGVGINNVRYRIETVCKGSMLVESNEENGTTITIEIPEEI